VLKTTFPFRAGAPKARGRRRFRVLAGLAVLGGALPWATTLPAHAAGEYVNDFTSNQKFNVFQHGNDVAITLWFNQALAASTTFHYQVQDYHGNNWVGTSPSYTATVTAAAGATSTTVDFGTGFPDGAYDMTVTEGPNLAPLSTYWVVVDALPTDLPSDTPFAMDLAGANEHIFSQIYNNTPSDPNYFKNYVDPFDSAVQLMGVKWARERFPWWDVEGADTYYNYTFGSPANPPGTVASYDDYFKNLRSKNIHIMPVVSASPTWANPGGATSALPSDPAKAYAFMRDVTRHYSQNTDPTIPADTIAGWEIYNEPDGYDPTYGPTLNTQGADAYAAFLKAAALGVRDGSSSNPAVTAPLVSLAGMGWATEPGDTGPDGSNAPLVPNQGYGDQVLANDASRFYDVDSLHLYPRDDLQGNPGIAPFNPCGVDDRNDARARYTSYSADQRPLWLTETGVELGNTSGLSFTQQKQQARYVVGSAVRAIAEGVDKHFFFDFAPYSAPGGWYGMLGPLWQPASTHPTYPAYAAAAAEAAMTRTLRAGIYLGRALGVDPTAADAHVFQTDASGTNVNRRVEVVWSDNSSGNWVTLSGLGANATVNITNVDGVTGTQTANASGQLAVLATNDPTYYAVANGTGITTISGTQRPTPIRTASPQAASSYSDADRIVVVPRFTDTQAAHAHTDGAYDMGTAATTVSVDVYDFSSNPNVTGTLGVSVTPGSGWSASVSGSNAFTFNTGVTSTPAPPSPPGGDNGWVVPKQTFTINVSESGAVAGVKAKLTVTATVGGASSTPMVSYIRTALPTPQSETTPTTVAWFRFESAAQHDNSNGLDYYTDSSGNSLRAYVQQAGTGGTVSFWGGVNDAQAITGYTNQYYLHFAPEDTNNGRYLTVSGLNLKCQDFTVEYFTRTDGSMPNTIPVSYGDTGVDPNSYPTHEVFFAQNYQPSGVQTGYWGTAATYPYGATSSQNPTGFSSSPNIYDVHWHRVAMVYRDRGPYDGQMQMYVDGVLKATVHQGPRTAVLGTNGGWQTLRIGYWAPSAPLLYLSDLDEVRVSLGARTASSLLD
jgi:hypothetical protein